MNHDLGMLDASAPLSVVEIAEAAAKLFLAMMASYLLIAVSFNHRYWIKGQLGALRLQKDSLAKGSSRFAGTYAVRLELVESIFGRLLMVESRPRENHFYWCRNRGSL